MNIEDHKLIKKIIKEAIFLDLKVVRDELVGSETQRQKYNANLAIRYISPIISQVKRIELISFCFNCKNKELKKSEKVIIPTENYFRDFIGLWDRVLNFIKYIYDIKQTSSIDDVIKNDTVDKKLRNKLKDIKDNLIELSNR